MADIKSHLKNLKNKSEEDKLIGELSEINEMDLSQLLYEQNQFLSEKNKYDELYERYEYLRSELYTQQNRVKKENIHLKNLLKRYKSRKVIKFADMILKIHISFQAFLKMIFNYIFISPEIKNHDKCYINIGNTSKKLANIRSETFKPKPKRLKDIKIAVILDEFSYNSFKYEFIAIPIEPNNWLEVFETEKPDIFFCESAWRGIDTKKNPWMDKIYFNNNSKAENRSVLLNILKYCNNNHITTIFWNKEDPTNFKVFCDTALQFDHIFTTDIRCVEKYKKNYGHKSVHSLMFAAQPKLFNPIEKKERSEDVIFAGSWYNHFDQRCKEMRELFGNILNSGYNLKIYDRTYNTDNPNRIFPSEYRKFTNPPVPMIK